MTGNRPCLHCGSPLNNRQHREGNIRRGWSLEDALTRPFYHRIKQSAADVPVNEPVTLGSANLLAGMLVD